MKRKVWQSGLKVLFLLLISVTTYSQSNKQGKVVVQKFLAPSIQNNKGGEDPLRQVSVYLPPGYNERYCLTATTVSEEAFIPIQHLPATGLILLVKM